METHKEIIWLLSFFISVIFTLVILVPVYKFKIKAVERWAKPFGWMFAALAAMYFIYLLGWIVTDVNHFPWFDRKITEITVAIGVSVCSALSNLFLLESAYNLWHSKAAETENEFETFLKRPNFSRLVVIIVIFLSALIAPLEEGWKEFSNFRLPDALVSAACLAFAGWAFYRSISSRSPLQRSVSSGEKKKPVHVSWLISHSALFFGGLYALLHVIYGITPWLVLPESVSYYDNTVTALALLLKWGIFIPAYSLLMVIINSNRNIRKLLEQVVEGRKEFLESEGLVQAIGLSLQASLVELVIKLPGTNQNQIAVYTYPPDSVYLMDANRKPKILSPLDEVSNVHQSEEDIRRKKIFYSILNHGQELKLNVLRYKDNFPLDVIDSGDSKQSIIVTPINYHGAIIGCLLIQLNAGNFKESDIQQIREISYIISPAVHAYREKAALDRLSSQLSGLLLDWYPDAQIHGQEMTNQRTLERVGEIMFDVLSPVAISILSDVGFEKCQTIEPKDYKHSEIMLKKIDKYPHTICLSEDEIAFSKMLIAPSVRYEDVSLREFGQLLLAIKSSKDDVQIATLGTYHLFRRVISNLVADALFNFARAYFGKVLKELGNYVNEPANANIDAWFEGVAMAADKAGLKWIAATHYDSDDFFGTGNVIEVIKLLNPLPSVPQETGFYYQGSEIFFYKFTNPREDSYRIVPMYLKDSEQTLWLGIGNPKFENELEYASPWKVFLERFAEISDIALYRIITILYKKEVAELQGLATAYVSNGHIIHQIINQARELSETTFALEEAIRRKTLIGMSRHRRMIFSLSKSADELIRTTGYFADLRKTDDDQSRSVLDAVQHASGLIAISTKTYGIKIEGEDNIPPDLFVGVPFLLSAFVIANLLSNAKDAIKDGDTVNGVISIEAEETVREILVHIKDNGPGIVEKVSNTIFMRPISTKPYGKGVGLYLSNRALRENQGYIELTNLCNPTKFTIHFPKPRKERL